MCRGPLGTSRVAVGRLRNCNWPLQKKQLSRARTRVYEPHHRRTASSVNLKGSVRRAPPRCCSGGSSSSSCRLPGRRSGGSRRGERCEWAEVPLLADRISSRTCDRPIHGLYSNKMALITSDCGEMSGATVCVLGGRMGRLSAGGVVFDAQVRCGVHAGNNCSVSTGLSHGRCERVHRRAGRRAIQRGEHARGPVALFLCGPSGGLRVETKFGAGTLSALVGMPCNGKEAGGWCRRLDRPRDGCTLFSARRSAAWSAVWPTSTHSGAGRRPARPPPRCSCWPL